MIKENIKKLIDNEDKIYTNWESQFWFTNNHFYYWAESGSRTLDIVDFSILDCGLSELKD